MQKFMSLPRRPGIQLVACLKNMAMMDIAERRASQDGKILRRFEGIVLNFVVQQCQESTEKRWFLEF